MVDVLIIGGGLAGTAAALGLADHGHGALLIEARPELGGRARSRPLPEGGPPVEYGGGWIRRDHSRMIALVQRLGLSLVPRAGFAGQRWFGDGVPLPTPAADMEQHEAGMARLRQDAARMGEGGVEGERLLALTVQAYFEQRSLPQSARREFMAWWAISGSGDPGRIGVGELLTPKLAKGMMAKLEELAFTVEGGVAQVAHGAAQASGATLLTGVQVERLEDIGQTVRATLSDGRILTARAALVAVGVNTLSLLRFAPPLAAAGAALRASGHLGRAIKVLIRARGVEPGLIATGETAGLRWLYADHLRPDGTTLIVGFGLFDETGEPTEAAIRAALAAAFPEAVYAGFDWHDWVNDPFACGTWVSPALDQMALYDPAGWTDSPRIAFAGGDLASAEQGWFEGALLTADAAVARLHAYLTEEGPAP